MSETPGGKKPSAFSWWLRTGKLPPVLSPDGLELKFNPWHDPADGRFTFAGAGRRYGASGADAAKGASSRTSARAGPAPTIGDRSKPRTATLPTAGTSRTGSPAGDGQRPVKRASPKVQPKHGEGTRPGNQPNPVTEFVDGVGEGFYDVGEGTAAGVHAALTTNPVTTVRNAGRGIAGMIDAAIAAEDTPARIQVSRAASAVANASARDIGRATGTVAANVGLAAAPGAALSKAAALRRLRTARPRTTYDPPQIGWVKETVRSQKPWKAYNDAATGARAGQAPALTRTMADGSKRPVKFDGIQGDYVIDRKWSVVDRRRARAQILRQSEVLAEHRLIGTWEVPTPVEKVKALKAAQEDERHQHSREGCEAMIAMQVADIIAEYVVFLELTDEEELNLDTAVKMMEALGGHLEEMDKGFLRELVDAFLIIAEGYSGEAQEVVRNIPYSFYLEEALAADDPVRLAELEALRDARD